MVAALIVGDDVVQYSLRNVQDFGGCRCGGGISLYGRDCSGVWLRCCDGSGLRRKGPRSRKRHVHDVGRDRAVAGLRIMSRDAVFSVKEVVRQILGTLVARQRHVFVDRELGVVQLLRPSVPRPCLVHCASALWEALVALWSSRCSSPGALYRYIWGASVCFCGAFYEALVGPRGVMWLGLGVLGWRLVWEYCVSF